MQTLGARYGTRRVTSGTGLWWPHHTHCSLRSDGASRVQRDAPPPDGAPPPVCTGPQRRARPGQPSPAVLPASFLQTDHPGGVQNTREAPEAPRDLHEAVCDSSPTLTWDHPTDPPAPRGPTVGSAVANMKRKPDLENRALRVHASRPQISNNTVKLLK